MKSKFLLLPVFLLLACDPIGRMTGTSTRPQEQAPVAKVNPVEVYEGTLVGANFVELPLDGAKQIDVYLKHKGRWILLEQLDSFDKITEPYYLISKNTIIFQNEEYTDLYSIRVTR